MLPKKLDEEVAMGMNPNKAARQRLRICANVWVGVWAGVLC